jgi:spore germination protein YaaH
MALTAIGLLSLSAAAAARPHVCAFHAPIYNASRADWRLYNWSKVDCVFVWRSMLDDALISHAHAANATVSLGGIDMSPDQMGNTTAESRWIADLVVLAQQHAIDGLNLDWEKMDQRPEKKGLMTSLVCRLQAALKAALGPRALLSFDLGIYPAAQTAGYDHKGLAACLDWVVPMAYDMTGGKVHSNSPLSAVQTSTAQYAALGVPASKLMLAFPWYGWDYTCAPNQTAALAAGALGGAGTKCTTKFHSGFERGYGQILDVLAGAPAPSVHTYWDEGSSTPWAQYVNQSTGETHQVVYDNPRSVRLKVRAAAAFGVAGVAFWTGDGVHRALDSATARAATDMWAAVEM